MVIQLRRLRGPGACIGHGHAVEEGFAHEKLDRLETRSQGIAQRTEHRIAMDAQADTARVSAGKQVLGEVLRLPVGREQRRSYPRLQHGEGWSLERINGRGHGWPATGGRASLHTLAHAAHSNRETIAHAPLAPAAPRMRAGAYPTRSGSGA